MKFLTNDEIEHIETIAELMAEYEEQYWDFIKSQFPEMFIPPDPNEENAA